jgi:hypothetical protein
MFANKGFIRCRFPEGSHDSKAIGRILQDSITGTSFMPSFYLEENYASPNLKPHIIPLSFECIVYMCKFGVFRLASDTSSQLAIEAVNESYLTRLSLRLQDGSYSTASTYTTRSADACAESVLPISGFPRKLWDTRRNPSVSEETVAQERYEQDSGEHLEVEQSILRGDTPGQMLGHFGDGPSVSHRVADRSMAFPRLNTQFSGRTNSTPNTYQIPRHPREGFERNSSEPSTLPSATTSHLGSAGVRQTAETWIHDTHEDPGSAAPRSPYELDEG